MLLKPALSFQDQVEAMKAKNLYIRDCQLAFDYLTQNNYYHLNKYFHYFMDSQGNFFPGTTFEKFIEINENDKFLRNSLFRLIDPIEIKLKTVTSNYLGLKYGSNCFYDNRFCKDAKLWGGNFTSIMNCVFRDCSHPVVDWHIKTYDGQLPIWAIMEFATFSSISKYFSNLKSEITNEIGELHYKRIKGFLLSSWFKSISMLRNKTAHGSHLFKEKYSSRPTIPPYLPFPSSFKDGLFAIMFVIKTISNPLDWNACISIIDERDNNRRFLDENYGFPADWRRTLLM